PCPVLLCFALLCGANTPISPSATPALRQHYRTVCILWLCAPGLPSDPATQRPSDPATQRPLATRSPAGQPTTNTTGPTAGEQSCGSCRIHFLVALGISPRALHCRHVRCHPSERPASPAGTKPTHSQRPKTDTTPHLVALGDQRLGQNGRLHTARRDEDQPFCSPRKSWIG
ncbi:hypothetical protein BKA81DRAFT_230011, partial [Phyllosticta paracitricarpa]